MKIEGSGSKSGSISQRHGSADPDPDSHQNVIDPHSATLVFRFWIGSDYVFACLLLRLETRVPHLLD
jgi:hypothetical protein